MGGLFFAFIGKITMHKANENNISNVKSENELWLKETMKLLLASWLFRIGLLALAAWSGIYLSEHGKYMLLGLIDYELAKSIQLRILLISLPVLSVLWIFRTFDTREQIQKTQENTEAARDGVKATWEALNANNLAQSIDMLSSDNLWKRCIGLFRLASIKRQGLFTKEIDSATRRRLNLDKADLQGENLSDMNLEGAQLNGAGFDGSDLSKAWLHRARMRNASFCNTNLTNADLSSTDLKGARFVGADLSNASLCSADLRNATGLEFATFKGAEYSSSTKFPDDFQPENEGMKIVKAPFIGT